MYKLTKPQKLIYDMHKFAGGAIAVICGSVIVNGNRDIPCLVNAVNELYRLNDALRMRILETEDGTKQAVHDYMEQDIEVLRFASREQFDTYANANAAEPLDLYGPLCDIKIVILDDSYGILAKLHHIIGDAWTLSLLASQFCTLANGETPEAYSYTQYIGQEDAYLQSTRFQKDRAFFLEQFKECDEVTYLSDKQSDSMASRRRTFVIDNAQAARITSYVRAHNTSAFVLFMTALAVYMNRTKMNAERFYIGTAVLNRAGAREKNTMGMFINSAPMLIKLDNSASFAENLAAVQHSSLSAFRHQKYNYGDVLADIRKEYGFTEKLYDVMLSYQNATITGAGGAFESAWYHSGAQTESLQVHIDDRDNEGIFRIHFDYQTEKFTEPEVESLYEHITNLLFDAVEDDSKKLYELKILSEVERHSLLYEFNDTAADYPGDKCVHQLFEEQAKRMPNKTAVIACDQTLTYDQLNEQANRIAHGLIEKGVKAGDIVAFALPRKSYLISTIFGILKAGAAYLPIDPDFPQERVEYMLEDSAAKLFITEADVNALLSCKRVDNPSVQISSDGICYCIYTSGSTGMPKGTLLKHRGIVNLVTNLDIYSDISRCERVGIMTTITFDVAAQEIFTSLLNGMTGILGPERKDTNFDDIVTFIETNKIDIIYATPTYFDLLTQTDEKADRVLSVVKTVVLAGEAFSLNRYVLSSNKKEKVNFENQYGPAETHVVTTTVLGEHLDTTIGKPIANIQIHIVDKYMQPVPIGVAGELCIAGDGVGLGYLNRPELTAEKFIDNPFGDGKLYKTGDLAYWREDGNIVYVGRNDFQVKIRGLRIELGEIENAITSVDGITQAAVDARKDSEGRQLICAFYTGKEQDAREMRSIIGKTLPQYMLPHSFTHLEALPLTASGKVNRRALPEVDLSSLVLGAEYVAPGTPQEKTLASAIQAVLGVERAGLLDNFFDLGGDSLKAIELIAKLEREGYHIDSKTIFASDTIEALAQSLGELPEQEDAFYHTTGDIPATPAQMRVYTAQSMNDGSTMYNVPCVFKVESLDPVRLQEALNALIERHEMLRTHFENKDGVIMQVVEEQVPFTLEQLENGDISAFIRPFDLHRAPLLRAGYFENTIMIDMHHIIADGGTTPVFLQELNALYMGGTLDDEPVSYRQFAVEKPDYTESEQYWLNVYEDEVPVLELNTDFKRGQKRSYNGNAIYDFIDSQLRRDIQTKCRELTITPYVFYMSAFYILLSKFSGNEDIVVGMPISGRKGKYLNTIGMFVNTIALRNRPAGNKSVRAFLEEVKDASVNAIAHQEYPYGELVKKLNANSTDRNPLFDVMFAYQSEGVTSVTFGDKEAEMLPIPSITSKYDFTFNIMPRENDVVLMAEYCTDLYRENTMQRLIAGYKLVLKQMLDQEKLFKDIRAITEEEENTLRVTFNDTAVDYPKDKCVHQLFEEQAQKVPDKTAIIACDRALTYAELNEQANYIASALIKRQISTGDIVAFALPRKSYLVAVILGILKTGAAYLPIDPDYPQDRIEFMLADSGAKLYITESNLSEYLTETASLINGDVVNDSNANCYCLYTSGTTGKPKATTIKHYNLNNFCNNADKNSFQSALANTCAVVLAQTTVIFDISIFEIFLTLLNGLTLVLASDKEITSPSALAKLIISNRIDAILTTPTKMSMYLENQDFQKAAKQLKLLMIGAETFPPDLLKRISEYSDAIVFNGYGPTETTIGVSFSKLNGKCVHQLFEEQAQKAPDKVAVIACDRTLTYEELNEQANKIAHGLIKRGVGRGDIVAFILPRKSYLLSTILGILKAGAAYMPIDPDYPQERIDYMLEDSCAKLCVSEKNIGEIWNNDNIENPRIQCVGEDLCYCIYTSGSTGKPKGTLLTHGCVANYVSNNNNNNVVHKIVNNDYQTVLSVTTVGFDIFVTESLLPLANGLEIIFANEEQATVQPQLNALLSRHPADVMQTTPTKMRSLISDPYACGYLKTLKAIVLGGEAVDSTLVHELQQLTSAHIFNIYGPTETTVWSTNTELCSPSDITIGKPIANTQIHIVDKYMQLAPIGTTGELCIAGDGVGAGYLNRPELTAEKFVDNPFGEGKLYKTGDLAYWREDGNIVYVGRNDFQVKIRGLRIELGEIESAICSVVGVLQAVVMVRKDNAGRQMICAFYTESAPVSVEQIRNELREKLPRYMMPHVFTLLLQMPLTSSGKINRKALPEVDLSACGYDIEYVKPEGALEKHLAQTMEQILGYAPVGRNDNFFDLGGDSLKAIEYVSKAYSEGIYFALQNVFDYPTVKLLAECIESGNKHEVSFDDLDFTKVNELLAKNNADNIIVPNEVPVGDILLAGATGYLGIHILADYMERDSGTAYCLVRGEDEADSKRRFSELLQFYFGDKYSDMRRIVVICADLQKDCFGLPEQEYACLLSKIDTVINAAASVKYGSYRYFHETNVETVNRLIKFCMEADAKLVHTSTLSVSGNSFADHFDGYVSETEKHFYETSLYIGQALDNVYARSKFEAERAVLEAMGNGLRANIMRMGNLTNRLSDGVFQKNHESNAFLKRVMAILEMGVFPEYLLYLYAEFTPIDEAANAVMAIARHFSDEYTVFHINSTKVYYMDKLLSYFKELGHDIKVVDGSTFADALRKTMEQSGMEHIFETFINDMDESGRLNYDSNIRIENDFTVEYLRRLGFEWTELGLEYLRKYISYFKNIGYLEGKRSV